MGRNISMPPRGSKPGFKIGRTLADGTKLTYWIAKQVRRDTRGFPDRSIGLPPLPPDADAATLASLEAAWSALCHEHSARLDAWIDREENEGASRLTITRYDGTILSACRIYQEHPLSGFHKVKHNTRKTYVKDLKLIERSVGHKRIRNVTVLHVKHWYDEWRRPAEPGGPERIDRAHDGVAMLRTVIYFNAALRNQDCKLLAGELEHVKFERSGAREHELTLAHVRAFVRTAREFGEKGIMPPERTLHLSIGVTAQFEMTLRQMDIIGEWTPAGANRRLPEGIVALDRGHEIWAGFFTWENIPGWRWRMKTSKSKYRSAADFDLTKYDLLMPLLEAVPRENRTGAIVKGEKNLPVRQAMYARWFRQIARAAGIPDEVWNMDARAGGATEADEAGAPLEAIQAALTHTKESTTLRYIRRGHSRKIEVVAAARSQKRAAEGDGTT
jgi:hypothetical protein